MAQTDSQNSSARGNTRRALIIVGVLALLGLAYAIARVDILRARIVTQEIKLQAMQENNNALRSQIETLAASNQSSGKQVERLQSDLGNLSNNFGELRNQAEQAQRQSMRSEALYLLRLANDQLHLAHDLRSGIDTLSAAEALLRNANDSALSNVHQQVLAVLTQLRSTPRAEPETIQQQLSAAEQQVGTLKLAGINLDQNAAKQTSSDLPTAGLQRAWLLFKRGLSRLFTIKNTGAAVASLLSDDEQAMRRRHLQMLLLNARLAMDLHDQTGYLTAVTNARTWLEQAFDTRDSAVTQLQAQLLQLAKQNIAPSTPDLSVSIQALTRYLPGANSGTNKP